MVERSAGRSDSPSVPTIGDLLTQYRDRTGASYEDMSRSVNGGITTAWFEVLHKNNIKSFPRNAVTIQHLAGLLQMPVATILLAYASTLGLLVEQSESRLAASLPPGTDNLLLADEDAIRSVIVQLVDARRAAGHLTPDLAAVEGVRLAEDDSVVRNGSHTPRNGPVP